jgi:hypothetical protein
MSDSTTFPTVTPRRKEKQQHEIKKQPPYHVILWNDDDHTYEYVIEMLKKLFAHPEPQRIHDGQGSRHQGPSDRGHHQPGTGGAQARSNPCLWPGSPPGALQGLDVGID